MDAVEEELPAALNKAARDLSLESGKTIKLEHNHLGHYFRVSRKVCTLVWALVALTDSAVTYGCLRMAASAISLWA